MEEERRMETQTSDRKGRWGMIVHRTALDDWGAFKVASAMDAMGHKVVSVVCRSGKTLSGIMGEICPQLWK